MVRNSSSRRSAVAGHENRSENATAILVVNNLRDVDPDRRAGKRTFQGWT